MLRRKKVAHDDAEGRSHQNPSAIPSSTRMRNVTVKGVFVLGKYRDWMRYLFVR
ncbi:hypothetical protein CC86DRAFT_367958 [Ophiobolus disseminans]|uniref:Uncharacterized protein n=1 Tax=Ophiobolus disseminans TaxID=1469910 RepID=A0A6A7AAA2_9PLEO|nr:hypothetical protein CC86DRAFT_367958 [Ophiobolus disseminans]